MRLAPRNWGINAMVDASAMSRSWRRYRLKRMRNLVIQPLALYA